MEVSLRHAEMCAALADGNRLLLLYMMADAPQNVSDLVRRIGLSQPAVSRHLRILRESGVITAERRGKSIYYAPADARIVEAMDLLRAVSMDEMQKQGYAAAAAPLRLHR